MNTKLLMITVAMLSFAQVASAYTWRIHNYTPFEIKAKIKLVGKDHTLTIPGGETKSYDSVGLLGQGVKIYGIKSMLGNTYFGGNSDAAVVEDTWSAGKAFGTDWFVFLENKIDLQVQMRGTSGTFSLTPTQQRFHMIRESFGLQPSKEIASIWFDPAGKALVTDPHKK